MSTRPIRCAIYTRKSSEEGLDQGFNSLQAQREACEAYVRSQASEGWRVLPEIYDDGGFSGGNVERPGLQRLLRDVDAGRIDTIVVYKIDRLTRSLADFARIVDRLDAAEASFVSVTQSFNTTTSMGRLTLNVLLSFAQFEREVTGERIRDKIAASKAKGMWMGGLPPLGYDPPVDRLTRKLVVNPTEADQVRAIFDRYLELGSVSALEARMARDGFRSKRWVSKRGIAHGDVPFSRGALFHLLRNRIYLGEIVHGQASFPGSHPPIVDPEVFDRAQALLDANARARRDRPMRSADLLLKGRAFDADGHPMSPSFGYGRGGKVYRYYVSAPLQQGRKVEARPGALRRVGAEVLETAVTTALDRLWPPVPDTALVDRLAALRRVDVLPRQLRLTLASDALPLDVRQGLPVAQNDPDAVVVVAAVTCRPRGGRGRVIVPEGSAPVKKPRHDPALIRALRKAHKVAAAMGWRAADGSVELAAKAPADCYERRLLLLAFLAPDIQQAILQGRQPPSLTLERLSRKQIPTAWDEQRRELGFLNTAP